MGTFSSVIDRYRGHGGTTDWAYVPNPLRERPDVFLLLAVLIAIALLVIIGVWAVPGVRRSRRREPIRSTRQVTDTSEHPNNPIS
jgi:hypothetical protein